MTDAEENMKATVIEHAKPSGVRRLLRASAHSFNGLRSAFQSEAAFRQEVALAVLLIPLGLWLGDTRVEKALLVGSVVLVLVVELLNTAVESVVDRIGIEHHVLSGRAKDVGSAAVFVALVLSVTVWALLLFP
jgi:diacylglycerol kinase (ATP)